MSFNFNSSVNLKKVNSVKVQNGKSFNNFVDNIDNLNYEFQSVEIDYNNVDLEKNDIYPEGSCYYKVPVGGDSPFANNPMVDKSGEISNFTDFQKSLMGMIASNPINIVLDGKESIYKDKTIWELYNSSDCPEDLKGKLENFINFGMGDFEIVEVVNGEDGFSAIVYKDKDGNYMLSFPCTDENVLSDIVYDAEVVSGLELDKVDDMFGIPIDAANKSQKQQAFELAKKYFDEAKKDGKQLNIGGYSLGGSLAEYVYLELSRKDMDTSEMGILSFFTKEKYENNDTLGNLIVYEPLHNDLSEAQVEFLKKQYKNGKVDIFSVIGSTVSSYHNYEDLKDITNFLEANAINRLKESIDYDSKFADSIIYKKYEFDYATVDLYKNLRSVMSDEEIEKICLIINNYKTLYSGNGHAVDNPLVYAQDNFNEDGSFKNNGAEGMSFTEITDEVFGTDMKEVFGLMEDAVTIMDDVVSICGNAKSGNILNAISSTFTALEGHGGSYSKIFKMTSSGVDLHKRKFVMDKVEPHREFGIGSIDVGHFVDGVFEIYDEGREFISNPIGYVADGTVNFANDVKEEVTDFIDNPLGYVGDKAEAGFNAVCNEGKEIVKDVGNAAKGLYNWGKNGVKKLGNLFGIG